ncbi:hypothetical protein [Nocardia sp. A7]
MPPRPLIIATMPSRAPSKTLIIAARRNGLRRNTSGAFTTR